MGSYSIDFFLYLLTKRLNDRLIANDGNRGGDFWPSLISARFDARVCA
jgi:hypothetical protein